MSVALYIGLSTSGLIKSGKSFVESAALFSPLAVIVVMMIMARYVAPLGVRCLAVSVFRVVWSRVLSCMLRFGLAVSSSCASGALVLPVHVAWHRHTLFATQDKRSSERRRHVTSEAGGRRRHRHTRYATQEKRSNEQRRHVTSEAKGPTAPQPHAVCDAREAKQ